MISDVLFEAVADIKEYLNHPDIAPHYKEIRQEIDDVVERMDKLRATLDQPPWGDGEMETPNG
jgi:hypothetical protein